MNLLTLIKMYPTAMYLWSTAIAQLIFLFNWKDIVDYMNNKNISNNIPILPTIYGLLL